MNDYHKIWESINNESRSNPHHLQIARRIPSNGLFNVFIATDFNRETRMLYIQLENDVDIIIDNLPGFRGLEISLCNTSIGSFVNQDFLLFKQSIPKTENIFESVISDICENVVQLLKKNNFLIVITKVLNEWKLFFDKLENEILSVSKQKGLIGELYFLKDYLLNKYSCTESLSFWTGPERSNHDFQIFTNAVEVKTTSTKQHKKFVISSEKQLDNTGLKHLYLSLFSLNMHSNMPDKTLPALIKEVYSLLNEDSFATFQFQIKLAKYGYNVAHQEKYTIGYSKFNMNFFEVYEGFPRLLQSNLPDGVGDLKYSVVVSACSSFEIKSEILNLI